MTATLAYCTNRASRTTIAVAVGGLWLMIVLLGFHRLTSYELRQSPAVGAANLAGQQPLAAFVVA